MHHFIRSGVERVAVAAGAALLGVGVWLSVVPATTAGAVVVPLDHFECYKASAVGFQIPTGVVLVNQFSPTGFRPVIGPVKSHCNPVQKVVPGAVFGINNPNAHLVCFRITATQPSHVVKVTNQFGKAKLVTGPPSSLCLPSWKSLTGPPNNPVLQPPGLDHFTCYPVTYQPGSPTYQPPSLVQLQDQFTAVPITVTVGVPTQLCLPTQKTLPSGAVFPITNPAAHLLCFQVTPTPFPPSVFDQNQFGTAQLAINKTKTLCLPSTKKLIS